MFNQKTIQSENTLFLPAVIPPHQISIKPIDLRKPFNYRQAIEIERLLPKGPLQFDLPKFIASPHKLLLGLFYREHLLLQNFISITEHIPYEFSLLDMLAKDQPFQNTKGPRFVNLFSISRREQALKIKIGESKLTQHFLVLLPMLIEKHFGKSIIGQHYQIRTFSPIYPLMSWVRRNLEKMILEPFSFNPLRSLFNQFDIEIIPENAYGNAPIWARESKLHRLQVLLSPKNHQLIPWQYQDHATQALIKNLLHRCTEVYMDELIAFSENSSQTDTDLEICSAFRFHVLQNEATPSGIIYKNYNHPNQEIPFGTSYIYDTKYFLPD